MNSKLIFSSVIRVVSAAMLCAIALGTIYVSHSAPLPPQAAKLQILTKAIPDGIADAPYVSDAFEAMGGKLPYTWEATGLPDGLSFGTSDIIHGKTGKVGTFNIVVTLTDNTKPDPIKITGNFKLTIAPPRPKK